VREAHEYRTHAPESADTGPTRQGQRDHDGKKESRRETPLRGEKTLTQGTSGRESFDERKGQTREVRFRGGVEGPDRRA